MQSTVETMTPPQQRGETQVAPAGKVDVQYLKGQLDGDYAQVRDQVRQILSQDTFTPPLGMSTQEHRAWTLERTHDLVGGPGLNLAFPTKYGGGGDAGAAVAAFETMSYGDLSTVIKVGVHWGLFGGAVQHLGTKKHHERYLKDIVDFKLPGCFAMTESGHGSDVQSLETTLTYDPDTDEIVVNTPRPQARKDYIGNAAQDGKVAAVFGQLLVGGQGHGVHVVLVPIRDEENNASQGVTIDDAGPKTGLHGVDNGRLQFDHVRVGRDNLLDKYGSIDSDGTYTSPIEDQGRRFFTMLGTLVQGRVSVAGSAVSAAKVGIATAVRHAEEREQFSRPGGQQTVLMDYLHHQRRLIPLIAQTYALHLAQAGVLKEHLKAADAEGDRRKLEARVAGHKAYATWSASDILQECREACGGAGYLQAGKVGALRYDTDVYTTFEGDNTVLSQLVTKGLLTAYKDQFGALDTFGTVRFVATQAIQNVLERGAARGVIERIRDAGPKWEESSSMRTTSWHLALLECREAHVVESLARRLRGRARLTDTFTAFNDCQDHVLTAARVHTERLTFEAFAASVVACEDPGTKTVLSALCDLYALTLLEKDRGWFLEHDRMSPRRSRALQGAINDLCKKLRPHAQDLTDAFHIPANLLGKTLQTHE